MAQECCTSCDSPLVTPYLSLSPDKNPPMTSCSFLFILLFAFGTSLSSRDPRRDLQKTSPTPNRNAMILAFCLEMGACKRQWCKENQRVPEQFLPSSSNQACYSWARQTKGIFAFPLLTIRYLYMFMLRIKSSSGLESVAHSLRFQGCLVTPRTGKAAHSQNPQVQSSTAAGNLGKLLSA